MRDLDVGRFLRLRNAIQGAMDAIDADSQARSGIALPEAYRRFRAQAAELVLEEHQQAFNATCPEWKEPLGGFTHSGNPAEALRQSRYYNEARVLMGALAGYLDGYVAETRLNLETEAYARERARAERPVGFDTS